MPPPAVLCCRSGASVAPLPPPTCAPVAPAGWGLRSRIWAPVFGTLLRIPVHASHVPKAHGVSGSWDCWDWLLAATCMRTGRSCLPHTSGLGSLRAAPPKGDLQPPERDTTSALSSGRGLSRSWEFFGARLRPPVLHGLHGGSAPRPRTHSPECASRSGDQSRGLPSSPPRHSSSPRCPPASPPTAACCW